MAAGIGFGRRQVAANYVRGFTILLDRMVSPGHLVAVELFHGEATKLTSRCMNGCCQDLTAAIDSIETVIRSELIGHWNSNRRGLMLNPARISYSGNPNTALALILEGAHSDSPVSQYPAVTAPLTALADNGFNGKLLAQRDLERAKSGRHSDVILASHKGSVANGASIPFPRHSVRILDGLKFGDMAVKRVQCAPI